MPAAVKMQAEYGDDINIVFVESQGSGRDAVQKMALARKWFGTAAMWTDERPVITGSRGIPNFVMLSAAGEVVLKGHPMSMHKQIEAHIAQFRTSRTKGPKDAPKPLRGVWKNFAKGKIAAALADANKIADAKPELAEAAKELVAQIEQATQREVARIDHAIEEGHFGFAKAQCKRLLKNLKGCELYAKVDERSARLGGQEFAAEVKAERALAKIEKKLYSKGASPATRKRLTRLAQKHGGTKAGARAVELAAALD